MKNKFLKIFLIFTAFLFGSLLVLNNSTEIKAWRTEDNSPSIKEMDSPNEDFVVINNFNSNHMTLTGLTESNYITLDNISVADTFKIDVIRVYCESDTCVMVMSGLSTGKTTMTIDIPESSVLTINMSVENFDLSFVTPKVDDELVFDLNSTNFQIGFEMRSKSYLYVKNVNIENDIISLENNDSYDYNFKPLKEGKTFVTFVFSSPENEKLTHTKTFEVTITNNYTSPFSIEQLTEDPKKGDTVKLQIEYEDELFDGEVVWFIGDEIVSYGPTFTIENFDKSKENVTALITYAGQETYLDFTIKSDEIFLSDTLKLIIMITGIIIMALFIVFGTLKRVVITSFDRLLEDCSTSLKDVDSCIESLLGKGSKLKRKLTKLNMSISELYNSSNSLLIDDIYELEPVVKSLTHLKQIVLALTRTYKTLETSKINKVLRFIKRNLHVNQELVMSINSLVNVKKEKPHYDDEESFRTLERIKRKFSSTDKMNYYLKLLEIPEIDEMDEDEQEPN